MPTVADILHFIESFAPEYMKEPWDHVGLNCGHADRPVQKILIALDPFQAVCQEAKDIHADLLVTHHALLWDAGFITDETPQGENALFLIENGIACINAHTNLDCAPNGVNAVLAKRLGLTDVSVIMPSGVDENGNQWGLLRCGSTKEQALEAFMEKVKNELGCPMLRYVDGRKPVRKVAVGGGACGSQLLDAIKAGCDTFVTADIKYNQFWDAHAMGLSLIDAGHFYTENPVCTMLQEMIQSAFPQIEVCLSTVHTDCMKFF